MKIASSLNQRSERRLSLSAVDFAADVDIAANVAVGCNNKYASKHKQKMKTNNGDRKRERERGSEHKQIIRRQINAIKNAMALMNGTKKQSA